MRFPQNFIKARPPLQNSLRSTSFAENISAGVSEGPWELGQTVLAVSAHCCQAPAAEGRVHALPDAADPAVMWLECQCAADINGGLSIPNQARCFLTCPRPHSMMPAHSSPGKAHCISSWPRGQHLWVTEHGAVTGL